MKKTTAFILYLLVMVNSAYAGHYMATDVSYRHLKNQEYEINVVFYRDCMGIPLPYLDLFIQNDSFNVYKQMSTRIKIEDVLYNCTNKVCNPSNTTVTNMGFEAHYFRDTIDFNTGVYKKFISNKYCEVNFAVLTCCRPSIQTSDPIYIEAMLDLCYAKTNPVSTSAFYNTIKPIFPLNQTYNYSFRTLDDYLGDSISYELVYGKEDYNKETKFYGGSIPVLPFCLPIGTSNCKPIPGTIPPRGLYFNEVSGNIIFCPVAANTINAIVCRIKTFRKDSGKYKLVGYSKRDMQLYIVNSATNNVPVIDTYRESYNIKAREKFCTDIALKDITTSSQNLADTIKLKLIVPQKYGQLSLLDSNAREKTLRYCWNPSDSDFIKKKQDNIFISAYDNGCIYGSGLSSSIYFKVLAPDSVANFTIRTFYDKNENGRKDAGEPFRSAPVLSDHDNKKQTILYTDSVGFLNVKLLKGQYLIGVNRSQFIYQTTKDTLLQAAFDSTYNVLIGFNYNQGIKGRVYEDINNNCVFDVNTDLPVKGIKVISQNRNAVALSDQNGEYLLNSTSGSHILSADTNGLYTPTCHNSLNASIVKDSQFINYNFPLKRKTVFSDIGLILKPQTHRPDNSYISQSIIVENKGISSVSNFYVKLLPSRILQQFNGTNLFSKDTLLWKISIAPATSTTLNFSHYLASSNFAVGDQITYQLWVDYKDNVPSNNYFELIETIADTGCCKTGKTVYAPNIYYPADKTITYKLKFIPTNKTIRALVSDVIDDSKFDLRTIQIHNTNNNQIAYLNQNRLSIEFNNSLDNGLEFLYSIDLKTPITDSFTVYNKASCNFDYQPELTTNTVATNIVSPIQYDSLSKTTYCGNETVLLGFSTLYKPAADNHFRVYLSDSAGNFSQQSLLLDTAAYATSNLLKIKLPVAYNLNTYKLKVTGTNPDVEAFNYITKPAVTILPLPKISFTTNLTNGKLCKHDSIQLKPSGAVKYRFFRDGLPLTSFIEDSVYSEKLKDDGNYQISFMSQKGCVNTSPIIKAAILPLPIVNLNANDLVLCDGEVLQLQFSGALTYSLFVNTNTIIAAGLTSSPFQLTPPLNLNRYSMIGADIMGCKDTSNILNILVVPLPAKPIISKVSKSLKSSYGTNNQWYTLTGKIDTAINQLFFPPADGKYYVKHTDNNGCVSTSDIFDFNATSVHSFLRNSLFEIYPNPAAEQLTILNYQLSKYSFDLYDAYGRLILSDTSDEKTRDLNIEHLSPGNYILRIHSYGEVFNFKVMVSK